MGTELSYNSVVCPFHVRVLLKCVGGGDVPPFRALSPAFNGCCASPIRLSVLLRLFVLFCATTGVLSTFLWCPRHRMRMQHDTQ